MAAISNTITTPDGDPLADVPVTARLKPSGAFVTATYEEVTPVVSTTTDSNGLWTLDLYENAALEPSDTYYEIEERAPRAYGGPRLWVAEAGAAPQTLLASLVSPLPLPNTNNYLTQEAGDARYVQSPGSFGTGTTESRPDDTSSNGILDAYARTDHRHDREITYGTAAERAALTGTDLYEGLTFRQTDGSDLLYTYRGGAWVQLADYIICTSGTRPSNPYTGLTIFETDTGLLRTYLSSQWVKQGPTAAEVLTSESTASTTYVALTTPGPSVSVITGAFALVIVSCQSSNASDAGNAIMSHAVSGATTIASSDDWSAITQSASAGGVASGTGIAVHTGLTPGTNVFTAQYRKGSTGASASFLRRKITVITSL